MLRSPRTQHHTKADAAETVDGSEPEAIGQAGAPGVEVPGAATQHSILSGSGTDGIGSARELIRAPLPDVAMHVVQAPVVGLLLMNAMCAAARVSYEPCGGRAALTETRSMRRYGRPTGRCTIDAACRTRKSAVSTTPLKPERVHYVVLD